MRQEIQIAEYKLRILNVIIYAAWFLFAMPRILESLAILIRFPGITTALVFLAYVLATFLAFWLPTKYRNLRYIGSIDFGTDSIIINQKNEKSVIYNLSEIKQIRIDFGLEKDQGYWKKKYMINNYISIKPHKKSIQKFRIQLSEEVLSKLNSIFECSYNDIIIVKSVNGEMSINEKYNN